MPHFDALKGSYLDFSHLPELKNIYITEIYEKKEYKSSIIKNKKITNRKNFDGVSLTHSHTTTSFDAPGKQAF